MMRAATVLSCGLILVACSGSAKINSYEDGMKAQVEVMEEMIAVLKGVNDEDSAKDAATKIESLGNRMGEIVNQISELPQPSVEEMQAITEKFAKDGQNFQQQAPEQMLKLVQYPALQEAWMRAMENMQ